MGAFQTLINSASNLTIAKKKMVGSQLSRNENVFTNVTPTKQPWRFTMDAAPVAYNQARQLLQQLDDQDRVVSEVVTFGNNTKMKWMFRYQGTLSTAQRNQILFGGFSGNQLTLNVSLITGATPNDVILEVGDLIQVQGYPYPFAATSQVLKGSNGTVVVTTHRPNIFSTMPASTTKFNWGNDCQFRLLCLNSPTYTLRPGAYQINRLTGETINNAIVEWDSEFQFIEHTVLA